MARRKPPYRPKKSVLQLVNESRQHFEHAIKAKKQIFEYQLGRSQEAVNSYAAVLKMELQELQKLDGESLVLYEYPWTLYEHAYRRQFYLRMDFDTVVGVQINSFIASQNLKKPPNLYAVVDSEFRFKAATNGRTGVRAIREFSHYSRNFNLYTQADLEYMLTYVADLVAEYLAKVAVAWE